MSVLDRTRLIALFLWYTQPMMKNEWRYFAYVISAMALVYMIPFLPGGLWAALPVFYFLPRLLRHLKQDIMSIIWRGRARFTRVNITDEALEDFMSRK